MISKVVYIPSQFCKSLGFDSVNLYLSSVYFADFDGLRNECLNGNNKYSPNVPLNKIQKIVFDDQDNNITIYFTNESGKKKSYFLEGFAPQDKALFGETLAQVAKLTKHEFRQNKRKDFGKQYLSILGTVIITGVLVWFSTFPRTGVRSRMFRLVQDLGPMGICTIGGLFILGILYIMYKQSRKPANEHVYMQH